jgi:hypothetical protein
LTATKVLKIIFTTDFDALKPVKSQENVVVKIVDAREIQLAQRGSENGWVLIH